MKEREPNSAYKIVKIALQQTFDYYFPDIALLLSDLTSKF
jgi:hypothetical protein